MRAVTYELRGMTQIENMYLNMKEGWNSVSSLFRLHLVPLGTLDLNGSFTYDITPGKEPFFTATYVYIIFVAM